MIENWHNEWAAKCLADYRAHRVEMPFHGPDLKTEKGPLPWGKPRLGDGGCPVCTRRNVHAPECKYSGPLFPFYIGYDVLTFKSNGPAVVTVPAAGGSYRIEFWGPADASVPLYGPDELAGTG